MSITDFTKHKKEPAKNKRTTAASKSAADIPGYLTYPIDASLDNLILNNSFITEEFAAAITDGTTTETVEGASTVVLNVNDPDRKLINKGILSEWVNVDTPRLVAASRGSKKLTPVPSTWNDVYLTVDGRDFTLVGVNKQNNQFDLTFENRAVNEMRRINKPKVWYRDTFTRAMVIKAMAEEVKDYHIAFFSPELHKVQPIASSKQKPTVSETKITKGRGFSPRAHVTVKGAVASFQQKEIIGRVITTGESMNASYRVLVSSIMCITQESDVALLNGAGGYGPFSQLRNGAWPASVTDVEADAKAYFEKAIISDRQNPNQPLTLLVQSVQRSGFPNAYAQWESEAKRTLALWGSGVTGRSLSLTEFNRFAFRRGQEGRRETSWDAGVRLAQEVNWRLFMLDNTLYFVTDNDLVLQMPWDDISEDDDGIDSIDYEIDTGKKLNECTVQAHVDRWSSPAGSVVVVTDDGPAHGRWLVHEIARDSIFSSKAEITLRLPQPAKKEPAPTTKTVSVGGISFGGGRAVPGSASKIVDAVYRKAIQISDQNYPYVFAGGGYPPGYGPTVGEGAGAVGYDCTGYVTACLAAAGIIHEHMDSSALAAGWGSPGEGKLMTVWATRQSGRTGHGFIEFKFPGAKWRRADTVPDSSGPAANSGPHVRLQWPPPEPDFEVMIPRHWPGT